MTRKQVENSFILLAECNTRIHTKKVLEDKGMGTFTSSHEALGIITEEYYELIEAVKSNDSKQIVHELKDIITACTFSLACINAKTTDW